MENIFNTLYVSVVFFLLLTFAGSLSSEAYSVSDFNEEYHNGQVFITWTNAPATNLQYNVYRSSTPLTLPAQLTANEYLGFVRDNSAQNVFMTNASGSPVYYKITDSGQPLSASKGLYVVTCNDAQSYYYVITVTNLSTGAEDKTIIQGANTGIVPIADIVAKPQAVFQDSVLTNDGEWKVYYVMYVDNRETPLFPAMNSTGSYGFTFFTIKRGTAAKYPLFLLFESIGTNVNKNINLEMTFTNCYIIGLFDWLPVPKSDGTIGQSDYFCCYHENFNIYINNNPIPATGVVRTYSQNLYWEEIYWLESHFPIDTTRLYCKGSSSEGYGALLTAALAPEKIAAVYGIVEPNSTSASSDIYKQMWGTAQAKLKTDRLKYGTGDTLLFTDMKDMQKMVNYNRLRSVPVIYDVHGKNDVTVAWNDGKIKWYDSLENNKVGGIRYWDQRSHGGAGNNFLPEETEPDYYRFATNVSYPAFSNCSVNQDPGNGIPNVGDPYGALNGYMDWNGSNIKDKTCLYNIHLLIKDFYVGGILDPEQYSTSTADVTIHRYQKFSPVTGTLIKWSNFDDVTGLKIQNGSFTYNGGLMTIPGVIIKKTGCQLKLKIPNCTPRLSDEFPEEEDGVTFQRTSGGYSIQLQLAKEERIQVVMIDLMGRIIRNESFSLAEGENSIFIAMAASGLYLVQLQGTSFTQTIKLFF